MALEKKVKSVLFYEGMSDDADRFLVEPPSVDYAENYRIDKHGSLQKRPGFGPDALTQVPDPQGSPFFLGSEKNRLYALDEQGVHTFREGGWDFAAVRGGIMSSDEALATQPFAGAGEGAYCAVRSYPDRDRIVGHVVAYEVRQSPTDARQEISVVDKYTIVQVYDENGKFIRQWKLKGRRSPQLAEVTTNIESSAAVAVFTSDNSGNLFIRRLAFFGGSQWTLTNEFDTGIDVSLQPRSWLYTDGSSETYQAQGPRLGQAAFGQARYKVQFNETRNDYVIAGSFSDTATDRHNIRIWTLSTDGTVTGSYAVGSFSGRPDLLAMTTSGQVAYVVYPYWEAEQSQQWTLRLEKFNFLIGAAEYTVALKRGQGPDMPNFSHASVCLNDTSSQIAVAWHESGYSNAGLTLSTPGTYISTTWLPSWHNAMWTRRAGTGVRYVRYQIAGGVIDTNTASANIVYNHRMTTDIAYFGGDFYVGLQQWLDYTPFFDGKRASGTNDYANTLPATKPVTTTLCKLNFDEADKPYPVAVLDAGTSCHADYGESEVAISLMKIETHDDLAYVPNRVKLTAESLSFYSGTDNSTEDDVAIVRRNANVETWASSLFRVHAVGPGTAAAPIRATELGDGFTISSATNLWFDGSYAAEFAPLDSPEIVRVEDEYTTIELAEYLESDFLGDYDPTLPDNTVCQPLAYNAVEDSGGDVTWDENKWRVLQAVIGYTDSSGNVHRSGPSAKTYVFGLYEDEQSSKETDNGYRYWPGRKVNVYVAMPLTTLPPDIEYFVELYASAQADDDPVLVSHSLIDRKEGIPGAADPRGLTGGIGLMRLSLNRAVFSDQDVVKPVERSSKPVYTAGGDLQAQPWPVFKKSVVTSTRLWALDPYNRGRVIPSKLFEDYIAPEYNSTLGINLGDERNLTAIGSLDDKVVVFEPNDIHIIYGDGPSNDGQGQEFAVHYIATDVGCEDQESVIETPVGLMFYSKPRGFYLLNRNMQVQYVGGGIEDAAKGIDIVDARLVRDKAEVRFIVRGGPTERFGPDSDAEDVQRPPRPVFTNVLPEYPALSYNYERQTWMTFSNYNSVASTLYRGRYTMLRDDWEIWRESDTRWDDPSGTNLTVLRTPWIRLSEQVQGFNRLWRMTFLGRYLDSLRDLGAGYEASDIEVRVFYDYEAEPRQIKHKRFQDFGYDLFNDPQKRTERFQFEIEPARGRCQAVKLEIRQRTPEPTDTHTFVPGRGFEISSVDFTMGIMPSRALISARNRM